MNENMFYTWTVLAMVLHSHIILAKKIIIPEDTKLDFFGLARKYGHQPVQYDVSTGDDYILTLFRLPGRSRIPVLLMHGFLDSADTFILRGNDSMAMRLANSGYDVWLGNCRGNRYSRRHRFLDPNKNSTYWDFSYHEMGYYDLPSFINKILKETEAPTLTAIGHSQGNTIFYVLGSTRPEYNNKINVMIALAPVCYLHNTSSPLLKIIMKIIPLLNNLLINLNIRLKEFFGYNSNETRLFRTLCKQPIIGYHLCVTAGFFQIIGCDPVEFDLHFFNLFMFHFPTGTSLKDILHFIQIENSGMFRQFDLGIDENIKAYNSTSPPLYELQKVTMPIALIAARNDPLSTLANVGVLKQQLANVVYYTVNPRTSFNHGDHVWARNMRFNSLQCVMRVLSIFNPISK